MADTVAVRTLIDDQYQVGVLLTSVSDGTGEAAVAKLTLAGVRKADDFKNTPGGITPIALDLMKVEWSVTGFTSVKLFWDATTDDLMISMAPGVGRFDCTGRGVLVGDSVRTSYAQDPLSSGHTGSINLTSTATAGGTYSIVAYFRKRIV
jgi:hypothetical protein